MNMFNDDHQKNSEHLKKVGQNVNDDVKSFSHNKMEQGKEGMSKTSEKAHETGKWMRESGSELKDKAGEKLQKTKDFGHESSKAAAEKTNDKLQAAKDWAQEKGITEKYHQAKESVKSIPSAVKDSAKAIKEKFTQSKDES